ncbi:hypothetical protein [Hymenobacter nivis]|uniref:Uncharacterized protein n=1 Tax=Hymenobacter nivis TaxID=1850093 RepID=A0A502GR73_9BACT|nr:hypothetical protein [Hymenobacter nivis]TPG64384.1 hypothetical protein EAH73_14475 [Hymenobacter nivis]
MPVDPNNRPIRVINDDTTDEEMRAGHHIPNADPPKNEAARGGFGNRDGKQGFGSDTAGGSTALGVNENADDMAPPADNMRSDDEGRADRANQDLPARATYDDDPDLVAVHNAGGPVDELDADDRRKGPDEMENPKSNVGMGEMEPKPLKPITGTDTNAELTDFNASDTAIDQ